MPDQMDAKLKGIVQKMIDAGESEENIASVIQHHHHQTIQSQSQQPSGQVVSKNEPGTWWGGFLNSLRPGGESDQASMQGLGGYAQGAVADLPKSMYGALKLVGNTILNPVGTTVDLGRNMVEQGIPQMIETTKRAGSNPEAFGRMMGQMTGQPLVTEGLTRVPAALRAAKPSIGRGLEKVGNVTSESGSVTGALPPFSVPRLARVADTAAGRGLRNVGQRMQQARGYDRYMPNIGASVAENPVSSGYNQPFNTDITTPYMDSEPPIFERYSPNVGEPVSENLTSRGYSQPYNTEPTPLYPEAEGYNQYSPNTGQSIAENLTSRGYNQPYSAPPPQLPPEFMPDIPMVSEEVLGGTSPQFGTPPPVVSPAEPPLTSVTEPPVPTKTTRPFKQTIRATPESPPTQKKTNLGEFKTGEVIILPKASVNPGRLKVLKDKGFEILEAKPNGDIRLRKL